MASIAPSERCTASFKISSPVPATRTTGSRRSAPSARLILQQAPEEELTEFLGRER
jgi:hypothetical protein